MPQYDQPMLPIENDQEPIIGPWQLPDGWQWRTIGGATGLCQVNPRRPQITRSADTSTSFLPMEGVDEQEGKIKELHTRPYEEVRTGYTYYEENDVLFAKITPSMQNGKSAIAQGLIDGFGFGSTEFHVLRPKQRIEPKWIHLFVRQFSFREEAKQHFRGAVGQQRVPAAFLEEHLIPIPFSDDPERSLAEQRRIVARLEMLLEEVRASRKINDEIKTDTDQLMDAVLAEVFPTELREQDSTMMKELYNINMGQSPPGDSYHSQPEGLPLLNGPTEFGPIHPTPIQWTTEPRKVCQQGDLLICVRGATTGRMNWADQVYCIGRGLAAISVLNDDSADLHYAAYFLEHKSKHILASGRGSTFPNLPKTQLESLGLPALSLNQQKQVVAYLDNVQREIRAMQEIQAKDEQSLEQIEQAILVQAFRGEL